MPVLSACAYSSDTLPAQPLFPPAPNPPSPETHKAHVDWQSYLPMYVVKDV